MKPGIVLPPQNPLQTPRHDPCLKLLHEERSLPLLLHIHVLIGGISLIKRSKSSMHSTSFFEYGGLFEGRNTTVVINGGEDNCSCSYTAISKNTNNSRGEQMWSNDWNALHIFFLSNVVSVHKVNLLLDYVRFCTYGQGMNIVSVYYQTWELCAKTRTKAMLSVSFSGCAPQGSSQLIISLHRFPLSNQFSHLPSAPP